MSTVRTSDQDHARPVNRHTGWSFIAISAIAIGLYAVPPYMTFSPQDSRIPLNQLFASHLPWLFLHALPSGIALLIGPFQFLPAIRNRWPKAHRQLGRLYLLCVLAGSCAAISATVMTTAGFHAQMGFGLLVVCWLFSGWQAYRAARQGRIRDHRVWMIRNYALTFAAVLLRVYLLAGIGLMQFVPSISFDELYVATIWGSIATSVLVADWFIVTRTER